MKTEEEYREREKMDEESGTCLRRSSENIFVNKASENISTASLWLNFRIKKDGQTVSK